MNLHLAATYVQPTVILDIGANVGGWYKEARKFWPLAKYLLIEGNDECRSALEALDDPFKIEVLSDTVKDVEFFTMKDCATATGCSYYREDTPFFADGIPHHVQTKTLDQVADGFIDSDDILLIKIDCQGAELDILKGGPETVGKAAALILEVAHCKYNIGAPLAEEVFSYLGDQFYVVAKLEDVCHPFERNLIIQTTVLLKRNQ